MEARSAHSYDPMQMKVVKIMQVEVQINKLARDVDKLMNIAAQHGVKIKELVMDAANNVSKVEFMSAITTTRYQSLNLAKSVQQQLESSKTESEAPDTRLSHVDAKDLEIDKLKVTVNQLENELFNINFKTGMDHKKLENEVKVSRKENLELRQSLKALETKLEQFALAVEAAAGLSTHITFARTSTSQSSFNEEGFRELLAVSDPQSVVEDDSQHEYHASTDGISVIDPEPELQAEQQSNEQSNEHDYMNSKKSSKNVSRAVSRAVSRGQATVTEDDHQPAYNAPPLKPLPPQHHIDEQHELMKSRSVSRSQTPLTLTQIAAASHSHAAASRPSSRHHPVSHHPNEPQQVIIQAAPAPVIDAAALAVMVVRRLQHGAKIVTEVEQLAAQLTHDCKDSVLVNIFGQSAVSFLQLDGHVQGQVEGQAPAIEDARRPSFEPQVSSRRPSTVNSRGDSRGTNRNRSRRSSLGAPLATVWGMQYNTHDNTYDDFNQGRVEMKEMAVQAGGGGIGGDRELFPLLSASDELDPVDDDNHHHDHDGSRPHSSSSNKADPTTTAESAGAEGEGGEGMSPQRLARVSKLKSSKLRATLLLGVHHHRKASTVVDTTAAKGSNDAVEDEEDDVKDSRVNSASNNKKQQQSRPPLQTQKSQTNNKKASTPKLTASKKKKQSTSAIVLDDSTLAPLSRSCTTDSTDHLHPYTQQQQSQVSAGPSIMSLSLGSVSVFEAASEIEPLSLDALTAVNANRPPSSPSRATTPSATEMRLQKAVDDRFAKLVEEINGRLQAIDQHGLLYADQVNLLLHRAQKTSTEEKSLHKQQAKLYKALHTLHGRVEELEAAEDRLLSPLAAALQECHANEEQLEVLINDITKHLEGQDSKIITQQASLTKLQETLDGRSSLSQVGLLATLRSAAMPNFAIPTSPMRNTVTTPYRKGSSSAMMEVANAVEMTLDQDDQEQQHQHSDSHHHHHVDHHEAAQLRRELRHSANIIDDLAAKHKHLLREHESLLEIFRRRMNTSSASVALPPHATDTVAAKKSGGGGKASAAAEALHALQDQLLEEDIAVHHTEEDTADINHTSHQQQQHLHIEGYPAPPFTDSPTGADTDSDNLQLSSPVISTGVKGIGNSSSKKHGANVLKAPNNHKTVVQPQAIAQAGVIPPQHTPVTLRRAIPAGPPLLTNPHWQQLTRRVGSLAFALERALTILAEQQRELEEHKHSQQLLAGGKGSSSNHILHQPPLSHHAAADDSHGNATEISNRSPPRQQHHTTVSTDALPSLMNGRHLRRVDPDPSILLPAVLEEIDLRVLAESRGNSNTRGAGGELESVREARSPAPPLIAHSNSTGANKVKMRRVIIRRPSPSSSSHPTTAADHAHHNHQHQQDDGRGLWYRDFSQGTAVMDLGQQHPQRPAGDKPLSNRSLQRLAVIPQVVVEQPFFADDE